MCGICGFSGGRNNELLRAMTASLYHRGPDEDGFYSDGDKVSLGMRRLKIIDLSTGSQPVFNEERSVAVVFNGEIYNFRELRSELQSKGHSFRSNSDTEVLVHLYEEHGADLAARLRGMFSFALWDSRTGKLLLCRDHFGIKPLFYSLRGDRIYFASEMKALLLCREIGTSLDPAAMDAYFRNLYVPAPLTIYKDIRKLEPAQILVFQEGRADIRTYWTLPPFGETPPLRWRDYLEKADALLSASVREQTVADVPLGLFLSGGIDSASLLYYMARVSGGPVKTFSVGYGPRDASFNELPQARLAAARFSSDHTEAMLDPDPRLLIERLAASFDEPFADASAIPNFLISGEARRKVTVALTGIGGDEVFGGYPRHLGARMLMPYLKLPGVIRGGAWSAARLLPESRSSFNMPGRLKRFFSGGRGGFRGAYAEWMSYFTREERGMLFANGRAAAGAAPMLTGRLDSPDDIFAYEIRNYLTDDLLTLADGVSMANSLELRVPFLDVRLVELISSAPLALKTRGFRLKAMLKSLMAGRLPPETLRGPKRGFQVPLARWYSDELKGFVRETLLGGALKGDGWLSSDFLESLLREHEGGRRNLNDQIHAAVMFELWRARNRKLPPEPASAPVRVGAAPLNILVCTDIIQSDDAGGSGRVAWETSKRLAAMGHRPIVITKGAPDKPDSEVLEGVQVYRYRGNPFRFWSCARKILSSRGRIDVMELHHPYSAFLALAFVPGVPAVYNFHSPWAEEFEIRCKDFKVNRIARFFGSAVRKMVERRALKSSGIILNASRYMAERLMSAHGLDSRIVPLGVDPDKFRPVEDVRTLRRRHGVPEDRFLIFTVRNLVSRMGLENLIEAAEMVLRERPEAYFIIGGSGYLSDRLSTMIEEKGLGGSIRLEGFIPDSELPSYYQCADLFVLPTKALEGFGLVTLEALACGTPVLATPVAATPEILGRLDASMLLDDVSSGAMAEGMLRFIPRYLREKGAIRSSCRKFVEENYSWARYAEAMEAALLQASASRIRS